MLGSAVQAEVQESTVLSPIQEDLSADPVPYTIVWRGGGSEVILSRAGDDDWKGRQPMERTYVRSYNLSLFFCFSLLFIKPFQRKVLREIFTSGGIHWVHDSFDKHQLFLHSRVPFNLSFYC